MRTTLADYRARAAEVASIDVIFDAPAAKRRRIGGGKGDEFARERHFTDLYAVFLHKLSAFALQPNVSKQEKERLQAFLKELLAAKDF